MMTPIAISPGFTAPWRAWMRTASFLGFRHHGRRRDRRRVNCHLTVSFVSAEPAPIPRRAGRTPPSQPSFSPVAGFPGIGQIVQCPPCCSASRYLAMECSRDRSAQ